MRFLSLLLMLTIAACGSESVDSPAPSPGEQTTPTTPAVSAGASGGIDLRMATSADVLDYVRESPAQLKLVNFWATWCVPCLKEFPDLIRVANDYRDRGVEVIFVSADFPEQEPDVLLFLDEQGAGGVSFLKNEGDDAFISAFDPEWMGELPATMLYGADDQRVVAWHGVTTYDAVAQKLDSLLSHL